MGGSINTTNKNAEALVVATKETGLEIRQSTWSCLEIRMQDKVMI